MRSHKTWRLALIVLSFGHCLGVPENFSHVITLFSCSSTDSTLYRSYTCSTICFSLSFALSIYRSFFRLYGHTQRLHAVHQDAGLFVTQITRFNLLCTDTKIQHGQLSTPLLLQPLPQLSFLMPTCLTLCLCSDADIGIIIAACHALGV